MAANTSNNARSSSVKAEQEQHLLNAATTNEQLPNKFVSNTKALSGKRSPAKSSRVKDVDIEQDSAKIVLEKDSQPQTTMTTTTHSSSHQLEDFAKKRQERDQEIMEIQEMFNKMKSPQKTSERSSQGSQIANKEGEEKDEPHDQVTSSGIISETNANIKKEEKETPFFGRCKTGLEYTARALDSSTSRPTRRDTARSSSTAAASNKPRSKSSQLPASAKETRANKKLNYNPEEARRYMEMQRKQRKENLLKDPTVRSKIEKEEIKKRLEELKKNTRKLAFKSMQKKEQFLNKNFVNKEAEITKLPEQKREIIEKSTQQNHLSVRTKSQRSQQDLKNEMPQKSLESLKESRKPESSAKHSSIEADRGNSFRLGSQRSQQDLKNEMPQKSLESLKESRKPESSAKHSSIEADRGNSFRSTQSLNNVLKPSTTPFAENHKRIGLLRKTVNDKGFSLASHRNYNFDKENQNLEMLTKQLANSADGRNNKETNNLQNMKEKQGLNPIKDSQNQAADKTEFELTENNLKTSSAKEKKDPAPNELPYWLRPSATHVYPYNFIMAVRRKLESIAQPLATRNTLENKQNQETSTTGLKEELKPNKRKALDDLEPKQSKKVKSKQEKRIDINDTEPQTGNAEEKVLTKLKPLPASKILKENADKHYQENKTTELAAADETKSKRKLKYLETKQGLITEHMQNSGSQKSLSSDHEPSKDIPQHLKSCSTFKSMESLNSEINSNFSSISLPIPISNTLTEVSSLRTESRRTYTHSKNQPLIHSEDELGSLSPPVLSSPEKNPNHTHKDFEFVKPRPVSPLSLEKVDKLKIKRRETVPQQAGGKEQEIDFTQLLEDFNRSLSEVIQVNEQLKNSLDKSQQILTPASAKGPSESDKYSSDFEKTPTAMMSDRNDGKLNRTVEKSNENLQIRKRQLFEIAEKIKPISSRQNQEMQIMGSNLKQHTNTTTITTSEDEYKSSQSNIEAGEKQTSASKTRLNEIEQLKETFKQTILQAKKNRNEKLQQADSETKDNSEISRSRSKTYTKVSAKSSELASKQETLSVEENNKGCKLLEKRPTQSKQSNENLLQANFPEPEKSSELDSKTHSTNNDNKQGRQPLQAIEKTQETTDYSYPATDRFSNRTSSQHSIKSSSKQIVRDATRKSQVYDNKVDCISNTQSEADSRSHTRIMAKSKTLTKSHNSQDTALSSSIAEDLRKTFETQSYDNEHMPFDSKSKTSFILNPEEQDEFVKHHVNRSRGDFQQTICEKSQFNETQFLQAIEVASQISSSEFAQSADDEITSSAASKDHLKSGLNPPSYNGGNNHSTPFLSMCSPMQTNERVSIGSEIVKFFQQYDNERTARRTGKNDSMSESSFNYSNVGLYEKLIQNETNKSQHLTALLKMREKALLDRTKGQIAWLEVQKARYKAKGLINQIAAIKKKQRGIILKMEKEREDIKRLLHTTTTNSKTVSATAGGHKSNSQHNSPAKHKRERLSAITPPLTKPKTLSPRKAKHSHSTSPILRATYELESSRAVEDLLKKREEDLRKRREHVERLMQWHQRLDEEEAEVLNLERQLLSYNNAPYLLEQQQSKLSTATHSTSKEKLTPASRAVSATQCEEIDNGSATKKKCVSRARKMEKRLKEIDKSLKELSHISASSATSGFMGHQTSNENEDSVSSAANQEVEFVRTSGLKLNKLWKRLTSQQIEKFEPTRRYKLCKSDLERLYEEAKMAVLRDFAEDEERIAKELLEKSVSNVSSTTSPAAGHLDSMPATACINKIIEVPLLNLNLSSGHSEAEEESANNSQHNTTQQGNYSPSVAEENFKAQVLLNSSASSETLSEPQTSPAEDQQTKRLENNVQMFLALSQRIQASGRHQPSASDGHSLASSGDRKLQRSLSDTEISDAPKYKAEKTTTSQKTIETIASHSNASTTTGSYDASAQHQRSKSSIVEMTYIPSTQTAAPSTATHLSQTATQPTDNFQQQVKPNDTRKDLEKVKPYHANSIRSSVICSVGDVTPLKTSPETYSDITSITEDGNTTNSLNRGEKHKLKTFAGQIGGTSCEATAKEISNKLDEITAAVAQLTYVNALPSYESVAHTHLRNKSAEESIDETNLSTDASSSYSFNFENITTDKHSSPGSSTSLNASSMPHTTLASKTYTKENDQEHNDGKESKSPALASSNSLNSTKSKTLSQDDGTTSAQTLTQSMLENRILDAYENDFELDLSNATHIEDISQPIFETTVETMHEDNENENGDAETSSPSSPSKAKQREMNSNIENINHKLSDKTYNADELKSSLSSSESEKSFSKIDFKSPTQSPDRGLLPPPPPPPPPISSSPPSASSTISNQSVGNQLMPDIINELELRRHQIFLDNEHLKQYEHVTAVPYMYVREIPNKPPPPYVPPAHGSPMTTIFPSEDRIKDITFRRTHELYCALLKTDYCNEKGEKLPSVMEEQITNIYERIILDICREYLEEHSEILRDGDPTNFHSQLAFFNPPNRLRCIQDAIYKEVRTCLAMDKTQPKRTQIYSVYGQRAKQDHIGKIIIQEMYDEDDRWCNFHREESEVLHLMVEEMINKNIAVIAKEVLLEEGGSTDEDVDELKDSMMDENAANHREEQISLCKESGEDEVRKRQQQAQYETPPSLLTETITTEDDQTYCVSETAPPYTVLNQTAVIGNELQENATAPNNTNLTTSSNAVQTCT